MDYKVGKIIDYENGYGNILGNDDVYRFLSKDVYESEELLPEDYVLFNAENVLGEKRAFFVRKLVIQNEKVVTEDARLNKIPNFLKDTKNNM